MTPAAPPALQPGYDIRACRAEIPILGEFIPMNNCSQAPQARPTRAAAVRYLDSWNTSGMDWGAWMHEVELARRTFADLINASPDEVAIVSSVSEATSAVASAITFGGTRDTVVASEAEFPTVGHVWLAQRPRGARVAWAPVREGALQDTEFDGLIDEHTAIVSACHGWYLNGTTRNLPAVAERAHAHGAFLFVDAYQTIGAVPVDVKASGVDFLASGNLKFLMGIPGIAFLYVRRELVTRLEPTVTGWFGRANPYAFDVRCLDWADTARRFDTGTPPVINACVARAGMEMLRAIGMDRIHAWHQLLARRLIDGAHTRGLALHGAPDAARKTASTAFRVDDAHAVERALRARGIIASARGPVIRLAPHYYSTVADVDTALDALVDVLARR